MYVGSYVCMYICIYVRAKLEKIVKPVKLKKVLKGDALKRCCIIFVNLVKTTHSKN
jgi:hypothetical protein